MAYQIKMQGRRIGRLQQWTKKIAGELAFCVPTCLVVHWVLEKFQ